MSVCVCVVGHDMTDSSPGRPLAQALDADTMMMTMMTMMMTMMTMKVRWLGCGEGGVCGRRKTKRKADYWEKKSLALALVPVLALALALALVPVLVWRGLVRWYCTGGRRARGAGLGHL